MDASLIPIMRTAIIHRRGRLIQKLRELRQRLDQLNLKFPSTRDYRHDNNEEPDLYQGFLLRAFNKGCRDRQQFLFRFYY